MDVDPLTLALAGLQDHAQLLRESRRTGVTEAYESAARSRRTAAALADRAEAAERRGALDELVDLRSHLSELHAGVHVRRQEALLREASARLDRGQVKDLETAVARCRTGAHRCCPLTNLAGALARRADLAAVENLLREALSSAPVPVRASLRIRLGRFLAGRGPEAAEEARSLLERGCREAAHRPRWRPTVGGRCSSPRR